MSRPGDLFVERAPSPDVVISGQSWASFVRWFWTRVDASAGAGACWPWTAYCRPDGYGIVQRLLGMRAHRVAWVLLNGPIPDGLDVLHSCDNPPCCNPAHLSTGTKSKNLRDAYARGRHPGNGGLRTRAKITEAQAREIRARSGEDRHALAAEFGLSVSGVDKVRRGRTWRNL